MPVNGPEYALLAPAIPEDHARISSPEDMLRRFAAPTPRLLDLGCGDGRALDVLPAIAPGLDYTGVDIETSPEVDSRTRSDARFVTYDGVALPFADTSFDTVYSSQVFEHIRHPDKVAAEVLRVLKPGGCFVGSLSYLEPYHSFSIFNFTPWGVHCLLVDNGFELLEIRPGAEGLGMIMRQITNRRLSGLKLAYPMIDMAARVKGWTAKERNYLKLRLAGHIVFAARKPA